MAEYVKAGVSENAVRCYTWALKNARHLQEVAPETFARDRAAGDPARTAPNPA